MREIGSDEQIEKKNRRNATIISIAMLGILLISSLGYAFVSKMDNAEEDTGLGNDVVQRGDSWVFEFEGQLIQLSYSPEDVRNISVLVDNRITLDKFRARPLYIASDNNGVAYEIASSIGKFAPRAQYACYGNCTKDLPVKGCYDNLIVWRESSENKVYQNESCVFVDGNLRAADAFVYRMFGKI